MSIPPIMCCPGTLAEGFTTYSPACRRQVFNGRKVSHTLPYRSFRTSEDNREELIESRKRISISGVQEKVSMLLDKGKLRLVQEGESGTYILKPIPYDLKKVDQVPANEHLTMQIAQQVYSVSTASNALIFFQDGEVAYLTRRFDVRPEGMRWGKEDFATLAGKTSTNAGPNFKYESDYQEMATLIKRYVAASVVEIDKFFALVIFNYVFSNGDAHLKNFSLLESPNGDYLLSPAYDLINTRLHVNDSDTALRDGLFSDDYETESFHHNGYYAYDDFYEFGLKIGMKEPRVRKILNVYRTHQPRVELLTERSFLSAESKAHYLAMYYDRLKRLNYSFANRV